MSFELDSVISSDTKIAELYCKLQSSQTIAIMVVVALQLARLLAVKLVEQELARALRLPLGETSERTHPMVRMF